MYKDFHGLSGVPIVELLVFGFKFPSIYTVEFEGSISITFE